ncbi:MAG: carboxymuconolactone decarboxylase family protein, partial [Methanocorpusculum sp.]|nr:carboxymuconolactone decarboxylase family protein [Methanocorpusculum sp.]
MVSLDLSFEEAIAEVQKKGAKTAASEWLDRVYDEFGSVPLIYTKLESSPESLISHLMYKNSVTQLGALDAKTVELISLAVGAALRCDHCTAYHMQVAQKMGITKEEILEAVLVAGMLANSSVLANAYRVVAPEK